MLNVVEMPLKGEVGSRTLVMKITLLIMEKSWNCVFKFLWVPCYMDCLCFQAPVQTRRKGSGKRHFKKLNEHLDGVLEDYSELTAKKT